MVVWDCYRPFHVQEEFWSVHPVARYVARPVRKNGTPFKGSKHNRGAAVDIGVVGVDGSPRELPTDFDDFSERAHFGAKGSSGPAAENTRLLRGCMEAHGFRGAKSEWWHFDFDNWQRFPLADEPL